MIGMIVIGGLLGAALCFTPGYHMTAVQAWEQVYESFACLRLFPVQVARSFRHCSPGPVWFYRGSASLKKRSQLAWKIPSMS